jgi:dipeptidase
LPDSWTYTPKTYVDRNSAWWAFTMVDGLSLIEWQNAIVDIKKVRDAAEAKFLEDQDEVESNVLSLYGNGSGKPDKKIKQSDMAAEKYLTKYTCKNLESVADAYWDLVDYLMFKYYFRSGKSIPITAPVVQTFIK